MKISLLTLLALFFTVSFGSGAYAQTGQVVQCGIPDKVSIPREFSVNSDSNFCDVYSRQLAYRAERQALRADIDARRANFVVPGVIAREAYFETIAQDHARQDREKAEKAAREISRELLRAREVAKKKKAEEEAVTDMNENESENVLAHVLNNDDGKKLSLAGRSTDELNNIELSKLIPSDSE